MRANTGDILKIPGRLIINPTDLTIDSPYGGTEIGMASEVIFKPNQLRKEIIAEEHGGEVVDFIKAGQSPQLGMFLRGFDKDALLAVFDNASLSDKTKKIQIDYPVSVPGYLASSNSLILLYAPENTEEHPGILLYNAIPLIEEAASINFSIKEEFGVPVIFHAVRDSTNRIYQQRLIEDMEL